jgi:hypothetical protein
MSVVSSAALLVFVDHLRLPLLLLLLLQAGVWRSAPSRM